MLEIAMGLGGMVMLQSLQLFSCEITDPGAAAIGAAAASMPCLRKLELAYNRISHDGMQLLASWLLVEGSRYRLTDLKIDGNVCGDEVTDSIAQLLHKGPFLQRVFIRGNFLSKISVVCPASNCLNVVPFPSSPRPHPQPFLSRSVFGHITVEMDHDARAHAQQSRGYCR